MKHLIVFSAFAILMTGIGSTAKAANPANWSFYLETYGQRDEGGPTSTFIDPDFSVYDYDWVLTDAHMRLEVDGLWYDIFNGVSPDYKSGSGEFGPLVVSDHLILYIDTPEIIADILLSVDTDGYGTLVIDNITFGQLRGLDIDGAKFWIDATVAPEPATLLLFGLGAPILLQLRRKH